MGSPPSGWRRHLFTENPLCGRAGIARRRSMGRVWWTVAQLLLVSLGLSYLVIGTILGALRAAPIMLPDVYSHWIVLVLAPYLGSIVVPVLPLQLLPPSRDLRPVLAQLHLACLTPGQITVGHLLRAGQALVLFQGIWIALVVSLAFQPEVWRELDDMFELDEDAFMFWSMLLAAILNPWLLLGLAWAVFIRTGRVMAAAAVVIPTAFFLNPLGVGLTGELLVGNFLGDESLVAVAEALCLVAKGLIAFGALRWTGRHFDRLIGEWSSSYAR